MADLTNQLEDIQKTAKDLTSRVATEGVTDESGRVLIAPTVKDVKDNIGFPTDFTSEPPQSALNSLATTKADADSVVLAQQEQYIDKQKQLDEINKALGVKPGETVMSKLAEMYKGVGSSDLGAVRTQAQQQQGIPQLNEQVKQQSLKVAALSGEIDKLEAQKLAEIDRAYAQQGVGMRYIQGQVGEIERKFNIEKAYKSAELGAQASMLQAMSGNLDAANNMVSDIVNDYTFDIQQDRKDVESLINIYGDWFTSLEKDQQNVLNDLAQNLKEKEENTKADLTQKLNLMTDAANAGVNLGLSVSDLAGRTLEEVTQLYQEKVSAKKAIASTETPITREVGGQLFQWDSATQSWKPSNISSQSLAEIQESTKNIFQQYKNAGYSKKEIEKQWKSDNGATELSPLAKNSLDEIFPDNQGNGFWDWLTFWK